MCILEDSGISACTDYISIPISRTGFDRDGDGRAVQPHSRAVVQSTSSASLERPQVDVYHIWSADTVRFSSPGIRIGICCCGSDEDATAKHTIGVSPCRAFRGALISPMHRHWLVAVTGTQIVTGADQ